MVFYTAHPRPTTASFTEELDCLGIHGEVLMFNGCTTTHIFCRPNCPPGRRTKPDHRVAFASADEAFIAGYRACLVCKPLDGPPGPWKPKRASVS